MVRFKNRYFLITFRFGSEEDGIKALKSATHKSLLDLIRDVILTLHGQYGLACVQHSLSVKYINVHTSTAIIRSPRDHYRVVWTALTTINTLFQFPCTVRVLHLGGTIQSCQKSLIKYNAQKLNEMLREAKNPAERRKLDDKIKTILKYDTVVLGV